MTAPSMRKLVTPPAMLGLFFLLFAAAAVSLVFTAGTHSPVLALSLTGMAIVGTMGIRSTAVRAREAELALGEGERYIEKVAELSQDIHAIMDAESGAFLYLNPAVEDLLGYPTETFMKGGRDYFYSLVHPDDLPILRKHREAPAPPPPEGGEEPILEEIYRIRNHHGAWRWFKSRRTVFVRYGDGRPAETLAVIQDITQQRSFESALVQAHKVESLGALVRGTVNDLNNTLMGIQGYAEIALEGEQGPAILRASLESVQASIGRATGLCKQILSYTGQGRIQISPHQLNDAVRESLSAIETLVPDGAHLVLDLQNDLPLASVDLTQARHALLNLVFNACESLGIRGGEITIRTFMRSLGGTETGGQGLRGDFVCLEVADTGPGTPPEILGKVFDPLFSTLHPGHGLGLSTVEDILREHQGAVHAKGEPGLGDSTVLYFHLAEKNPEIDEGDEGTPLVGASGVLLLVDDEPTIRAILRQGFENAGFKVIEGVDGVDGFASFVRHRSSINAVLLDLTMPRMGGDEVFEEIHKLAPEVPVVLMSGYSQEEATTALAGRGLAGFLSKPCSIKEALAVVSRALAAARAGA
ncbi:PAS domain-containing hybrid sensor histidine kinase/response regulator [Geothrix sp. 21YS21S-2]|uniref:PAS domain-containing hybrid sensor histidine kinase/response regulator n=1 Tax=Geothrix sp. 21YS21S-2 TaxID=3068893 RepID=UPI0027B996AD|nr:PAS domain-containing hybrid sensor histidine kinase/response regulator [Geothrix sp. 21YS21S-2]